MPHRINAGYADGVGAVYLRAAQRHLRLGRPCSTQPVEGLLVAAVGRMDSDVEAGVVAAEEGARVGANRLGARRERVRRQADPGHRLAQPS